MANDDDVEYSESGQPIYRHKPRERGFELAAGDEETIEAVTAHITEHVGPIAWVFHELISDTVHLDVHVVEPTRKQPFFTLVTSGMSDRPMTLPEGVDAPRFAELCVCLSDDWRVSEKAFKREENYWPVRWLKTIARLPHDYDTWLGPGHTVPHGDPPEPYADDTEFCCLMVAKPVMFGKGFRKLTTPAGRATAFYSLLPLYREEVELKLRRGADELLDLFDEYEIDDVIEVGRPNVAKKRRK